MFTAASRSGLIVKEEMPRSYFGPSAGRMPVNSAVCDLDLQAQRGADRLGDVDVVAHGGLAVGAEEFRGGVGGIRAHGQGAFGLDRLGQHGRQGIVLLDGAGVKAGRGTAGSGSRAGGAGLGGVRAGRQGQMRRRRAPWRPSVRGCSGANGRSAFSYLLLPEGCVTRPIYSVSPNKRCTSQKTKFHYWITKPDPNAISSMPDLSVIPDSCPFAPVPAVQVRRPIRRPGRRHRPRGLSC